MLGTEFQVTLDFCRVHLFRYRWRIMRPVWANIKADNVDEAEDGSMELDVYGPDEGTGIDVSASVVSETLMKPRSERAAAVDLTQYALQALNLALRLLRNCPRDASRTWP